MANEKTMTMREFLTAVSTSNVADTIKDYALAQITKLDEKNAKKRTTQTTTQKDNEVLKENIFNFMITETTYTAKMLADNFNESTQKITALMKQLVAVDKVEEFKGYKPEGAKSKCVGYIKK